MFEAVVDAFQHDVFEGDFTTPVTIDIAAAGLHQFLDRVLAIDRHQLIAQTIVGRMQRYRERHVGNLLQLMHGRNHAGGTDRDAALAQRVTKIIAHHIDRGDHRVKVEQGLAHAHHHDIGHALLVAFREQAMVGKMQLGDYLGGGQVAIESLLRGRAETAVQRTAQLRGNAQGHTRFFRDQYALDGVIAVVDAE